VAGRGDLGGAQVTVTLDVVTGAFSYTGRHIAEALLARGREVRTLTRRPAPVGHPLAENVEARPFLFDDVALAESLEGADTLYNTYWVRFERGETTFTRAVENTRILFDAAKRVDVRRIVHVSVANSSADSPFAYFRGKAATEEALRDSRLSHAIVKPTLVFGPGDILVNNIAWALRHVPVFLVSAGEDEVQPVSVFDTARICVEAGESPEDVLVDAAGPERLKFDDFVRLIKRATGGRAWIRHAPETVSLATARMAGLFLRDVILTRDELGMLKAGLLVSHEEPLGSDSFSEWVLAFGDQLGRRYASELGRNFRA
jgi:uncharacterized protein YbjT (DUF2867 family)